MQMVLAGNIPVVEVKHVHISVCHNIWFKKTSFLVFVGLFFKTIEI